jgi:hypothetical protein
MKKHFQYLKYLLRHKWYVMLACFSRGLFLRGIVHDLSKFRPSEWMAYAEYFYGEKLTDEQVKDNWRREQALFGYRITLDKETKRNRFNVAWLLHQHRNPHHWQHWVLKNDDGTTLALEMPRNAALEMLADWEGAGMAITGKREYQEWYLKNRHKMLLHPRTQAFIEEEMSLRTYQQVQHIRGNVKCSCHPEQIVGNKDCPVHGETSR